MTPRHPRTLAILLCLVLPGITTTYAACEPDTPARPVPQFDHAQAPGVSLWPVDPRTGDVLLRPAKELPGVTRNQVDELPAERDSTHYAGTTNPGIYMGDEIFQHVAAPGTADQNADRADWVVAFYNAGFTVWDLRQDPEEPRKAAVADGWTPPWGLDQWAVFTPVGKQSFPLKGGDVLRVGDLLYIAAVGLDDVGVALWVFDTTTEALEQKYQHPYVRNGRDVDLVNLAGGGIYALVADLDINTGGIRVYDVVAATQGDLCVEPEEASPICDVFLGRVGTIAGSAHVSARSVDGTLVVAAADGVLQNQPMGLEIWEVSDPQSPSAAPEGTAVQRFSGLGSLVHSPQLFTFNKAWYLALVESLGGSGKEQMRIHQIDHCLDEDGCASLGGPKAVESIQDSLANFHFLDVSFSEGTPFLHYGMEGNGLFGSGFEHLWSLGHLPDETAPDTLPELTDLAGSYTDPCEGYPVDYFGDYYPGNDLGLRGFSPRHAIFSGPYLYRAAESVFDIHVWSGGGVVGPTGIFSDGFESGDCRAWSLGCATETP